MIARRHGELLPLGLGQALAGEADVVVQPHLDHRLAQVELVEHLGHRRADRLGGLGAAEGEAAEQDVVLQLAAAL